MADAAEAEQPSEFATYDYEHAQQQVAQTHSFSFQILTAYCFIFCASMR